MHLIPYLVYSGLRAAALFFMKFSVASSPKMLYNKGRYQITYDFD